MPTISPTVVQCLRLLENDQVTPDEVEGALKDGIEYYLQSSTEAGKQEEGPARTAPPDWRCDVTLAVKRLA
jgi:hypothetical protein